MRNMGRFAFLLLTSSAIWITYTCGHQPSAGEVKLRSPTDEFDWYQIRRVKSGGGNTATRHRLLDIGNAGSMQSLGLIPEFTESIRNITTPVGREAVLTCTVKHLGKYKVGWLKAEDQTILTMHDKVVTHNQRISVRHDNRSTWQLHIRHVKETDRGCYMCQVNTNVMKKQIGCIDVHVAPDILYEETSSDLSILEGENASLICSAKGHPEPRISWRREDLELIHIRKSARESIQVESYNGSKLFFWKVDRKQMGAYLCIASNDVPPAVSKRIILNVNFAPNIRVPSQLLGAPLFTDVQLECSVEAFPNTVNYWHKNGGEIIFDGWKFGVTEVRSTVKKYVVQMTLLIRNFNRSDVGTYSCISTNSIGRAEGTLRLYDQPELSESSQSQKASQSGDEDGHGNRNSGDQLTTVWWIFMMVIYLPDIVGLHSTSLRLLGMD